MAESFVFSIAKQLLGQLSSAVFQELSLAWGLKDDIRRLENTISSVCAVLLDAQERQSSNHQLKDWIGKLEDALHRAEDVLEEFEIDALRYLGSNRNILKKISREFSRSNRIIFRFKMARKVKTVREEFDEIAADRNRFNLIERFDERVVVQREMTHSFVRAEDVIGRDEEKEVIVSFLMSMSHYDSVPVLPIIGLGGIGKTTLAKMAYNDERVVAQFDLRIWVCISEEFELEKVIKEILTSVNVTNCDNLRLEQLQQFLQAELKDKKYLLILDDVWNENRVKWIDLKNLLMGGARGSKIVITTRNQSVASIVATTDHSIDVEGLSHEESLTLFMKWAFSSREDIERYPRLEKISGEIVVKCKGIPLAIRTLGSLLYTKREENEWINVRDNDIWKIEQKEHDILPALKLSYYQLPINLRRCIAFCSIFPKNYKFWSDNLTMMWQANGMLKLGDTPDMADVAMMYIKQLVSTGFFQEFKVYGTFASFKMHDLVHDLALLVAQCDCINLNLQGFPKKLPTRNVRHISFPRNYFTIEEFPNWLLEQKENVRTIVFPDGVGDAKVSFIKTLISKFKSLRLLDLKVSSFEVLPSSIGGLKHLEYLDLSNNDKLKSLPASISKLVGLEALHFTECRKIEKLPAGFGKLIRLKQLSITTKELYLPENEMRCLTSLHTLDITYCPNPKFVMSDDTMQCISALRSLVIHGCGSLVSLPLVGLRHLVWLENLRIFSCENLNLTRGDHSDNSGATRSVCEEGFQSLHTFKVFKLPKLETLPSWLLQGAKNLKHIQIWECQNLTKLVPEGMVECLKSLQTLEIANCPNLASLPEGMHCLTALQEVMIWGCPELVRRCQRETGEDWHKISHVPVIYLDHIKIY